MESYPLLSSLALALALGYFFAALYMLSYPSPDKVKKENPSLSVAVLVAMRNEERTIAHCLEALEKQDYPTHLYNVYVIDDQSTDRSVDIASAFVQRSPHFHLIKVRAEKDGLRGKMNALAQAMEAVEADIILITDADCIVPSSWISTHCAYFDRNTGMVGALTLLEPPDFISTPHYSGNFFAKLQALDWIYLQSVAAASSNASKPITILGNNFGFRKKAYDETGGFKALGFSPTEDFVLMRAIERLGNWEIKHTLDKDNTIFSYPADGLAEFFRQRLRWVIGGRQARPWGYFIMGLAFLTYLFIILILAFAQYNLLSAGAIGLVLGIDYLIIKQQTRKTGLNRLLTLFFPYEIFHFAYTLFFGLIAFLPLKIKWKGREF